MQSKGYYTIQGHWRSPNFGTSRRPICDFLLVINTNLHPISRCFKVIAHYCSNLVRKMVTLRFWAPFWGLRSSVYYSSYAHWKALSGLFISVNWTLVAIFARE